MTENLTYFRNPLAEGRAFALLKDIVDENSRSLKLEEDKLIVTTQWGKRYFIELRTAKVYNESGKFVCVRVLTPNLPVVDQVIAKSLHLLAYPEPSSNMDHDLLFKLTFIGVDPHIEWPWIRSMSYSTLGETFSTLIGADFAVKEIKFGDLAVKLQMWYVNYNNRFRSIRVKHVKGSMGGVILSTANSDHEKIKSFQTSIDELRSCNGREIPIVFVGLYDEAEASSSYSETLKVGEEIANRNNIPFFHCSIEHPSLARKPLTHLVERILGRRTAQTVTSS